MLRAFVQLLSSKLVREMRAWGVAEKASCRKWLSNACGAKVS